MAMQLNRPYRLRDLEPMEDEPGLLALARPQVAVPAPALAPFNPVGFDWTQGVQNIGGTIYQPQFEPVSLGHGEEGGMYGQGALQGVLRYKEGATGPGQSYEIIDPVTGQVTGTGKFKEQSRGFFGDLFSMTGQAIKDTAPIWGSALGLNALLGPSLAAAGGATGAAGAGPLTAGITPASIAAAEAALPAAGFGADALIGGADLYADLAAAGGSNQPIGIGLDWFADQPMTKLGTPLQESAPWWNPVAQPDLAAGLPGASGGEGLLGGGSALSQAGMTTQLAAPTSEFGSVIGLNQSAIGTGLNGGLSGAAVDPAVQQIVTTGSRAAAPSLLSTAGPAAAAAAVAASTIATDPANYSNEGVNPTDRANMGPDAKPVPTVDVSAGPLDGLKAWAVANPELAKLLFSGAGALLNTVGGGGGNGNGGYVDSGYRPTISRGGWDAQPQARQMQAQPTGLLMTPKTGEAHSGLWRYGLLDGASGAPQLSPPVPAAPIGGATAAPPMRITPGLTPVGTPVIKPAVTPASVTPAATALPRAAENYDSNAAWEYINMRKAAGGLGDAVAELERKYGPQSQSLLGRYEAAYNEHLNYLQNQGGAAPSAVTPEPAPAAPPATPTPSVPQGSEGFRFATQQGGMGEDKFYENIANFLRNNPAQDAQRAAMQQYGISEADVYRAKLKHNLMTGGGFYSPPPSGGFASPPTGLLGG